MQKKKKILCATDLSDVSGGLICLGVELCLRFDASFLIFHAVVPPRGSLTRQLEFERGGEKDEKIIKAREKIEKRMQGVDLKWEPIITYGDPVLEVARVAEETKTDIVIAASRGVSSFQQFFIGSVIRSMVQSVLHPVLVMPPGKPGSELPCPKLEFANIIIACSLTQSDEYLKNYAVSFCQKFNSTICLVHVMESPVNKDFLAGTCGHYDETQTRLEEVLTKRLKELIPCKTQILHGVPGEELALYATREKIDLIIAGVEDRPGRMVATTTATLLRYSPCALLTVPINL